MASEPSKLDPSGQSTGRPAKPERTILSSRAGAKSQIFLSWGGEIYGPATAEEVANGIRASWFEESTLYWHEGLEEWKPVHLFAVATDGGKVELETISKAADLPTAPSIPATTGNSRNAPKKSRRSRSSKPATRLFGHRGRTIFLLFAVLAVLLTVGILLLLMLV